MPLIEPPVDRLTPVLTTTEGSDRMSGRGARSALRRRQVRRAIAGLAFRSRRGDPERRHLAALHYLARGGVLIQTFRRYFSVIQMKTRLIPFVVSVPEKEWSSQPLFDPSSRNG
jgi:hypothetical protein